MTELTEIILYNSIAVVLRRETGCFKVLVVTNSYGAWVGQAFQADYLQGFLALVERAVSRQTSYFYALHLISLLANEDFGENLILFGLPVGFQTQDRELLSEFLRRVTLTYANFASISAWRKRQTMATSFNVGSWRPTAKVVAPTSASSGKCVYLWQWQLA